MASRNIQQGLRIRIEAEGLRHPAVVGTRQGKSRAARARAGTFRTKSGGPGAAFLFAIGDRTSEIVAEQHEQLARKVQDAVVKELKGGIKRKSTKSGRLEKVTADENNIVANALQWGVGVDEFLNKSTAKYWRTIDEGSLHVWSRPFKGRFYYVSRGKEWGGEITHGEFRSYAVGDFMASVKGRTTEKLRPFTRAKAREIIAEAGKTPKWLGKLYITKEISPEDYYNRGFAKVGGATAELRVLTNTFDKIFNQY